MRVAYILAHPTLGGGTKVVAQHAALLRQAGVDVTLLASGPRPAWLPFTGRYIDVDTAPPRLPSQDVAIATYWTTLARAVDLGVGPVAHFCQGYEGRLDYLRDDWPRIDSAYAHRVPTIVVTPDLAALLERQFGRACRVVPPVVDPLFTPRFRWRPRRQPWIAIPGVFEAGVKDVPTALRAVLRLRAEGCRCRVLRISTLPLSDREREILTPDTYLHAAAPREVARALRDCDLLLFPSRAEEGFGLPLLEAMTSGVPAVATRIPSAVFMTADAVPLVDEGDDRALAASARDVLADTARWRRLRRRQQVAAGRFEAHRVLPELLAAVEWASRSTT